MIRQAATSTDIRKQKTLDILREFDYNTCDVVRGFGMLVNSSFAEILARILNAPDLIYGNNKKVRVARGQWRNEEFISMNSNIKWCILCLDGRAEQRLLEQLCHMVIYLLHFFLF